MLFSAWALECLELYKKPFVKGNTYSGTYLAPVQQRLVSHFGEMALDAILPIHVQKYINKIAETYSPESVKKDYTILSFIMQHAVDNGLCKVNQRESPSVCPKLSRRRNTLTHTSNMTQPTPSPNPILTVLRSC